MSPSDSIIATLLDRLAAGESLSAICRDNGYPAESTIRLWALTDRDGFAARYARARELQADYLAEDTLRCADSATAETAQAVRLQVDARKWFASKVAPKKYGDRVTQEISGPDGEALQVNVSVQAVKAIP